MKATYRILAVLIPVLVLVQAASIAFEMFGLGAWVDKGHTLTKSVLESDTSPVTGGAGGAIHGLGAIALVVVALALLVVSFFARIPGGVRWAAIVLGDVLLQWVFAIAGFIVSWQIGALHGLNAIVLAGLGGAAAANARRSSKASTSRPMADAV